MCGALSASLADLFGSMRPVRGLRIHLSRGVAGRQWGTVPLNPERAVYRNRQDPAALLRKQQEPWELAPCRRRAKRLRPNRTQTWLQADPRARVDSALIQEH